MGNVRHFIIGAITALALGLLVARPATVAQQRENVYRIGWLAPESTWYNESVLPVFLDQFRALGWIENQHFIMVYATDSGQRFRDRASALATQLVRHEVDVIVTHTTNGCLAAKAATAAIPIVMAGCSGPVERGVVKSLRHPGGNITGLSNNPGEGLQFGGKLLQVLQETVPGISRVGVLYNPWALKVTPDAMQASKIEMQKLAHQLGINALVAMVEHEGAYADAFDMFIRGQADSMIVSPTPLNLANAKQIGAFALEHRLPMVGATMSLLNAGGLVLYGPDFTDLKRRSAFYVDKILRGAAPAELPVEQPTKFRMVINLKTARQLGITLPPAVLVQADQVIR